MTSAPLLLKPPEAARLLSVSRTTVYELAKSGQLKSIRVGRSVRIPESAIAEFIESKLAENTQVAESLR